MTTTPKRRRVGAATLLAGAAFVAAGFLSSPAQAGEPVEREYTTGYDSYLKESQLGTTAEAAPHDGTCPSDASVDDLDAWHFILDGNAHDFVSIDVTFNIDGTEVELTGLTPIAKPTNDAEWAAFDPETEFIADPDGKHAYVFAGGDADDFVVDAAAQLDPEADAPADFQLSHTCVAEGGGTDGTTDDTTTDDTTTDDGTTDDTTTDDGSTDQVLGTDSVNPTTTGGDEPSTDDTEVQGKVVQRGQLPRTGDSDQSLFLIGMGLITIGAVVMIARRELFVRS
jgi:LPXTG-motif cell wall-anchored protein